MLWIWAAALDAGATPTPPLTSEMHARYLALAAARDAVVQGDLAGSTAAIGRLASPEAAVPFPDAWRPMDDAVRAAAARVGQARDLPTAALRLAEVATACAACHTATEGGPAVTDADIPAQGWVAGQNMPLHRWAVDWMWLGLVADSDEAWLRGARELDDKPLAPKFPASPTLDPRAARAAELEQRVYALAARALATDGAGPRATLMGELLSTCATCHTARPEVPR